MEILLPEQFHKPWVEGVRGGEGAVTYSYCLKDGKAHEPEKHIKKQVTKKKKQKPVTEQS